VFILGDVVTIKPGDVGPGDGPKTWTATGKLDRTTCSASIDFRVPGKTSPPPVALNATFWKSYSGDWSRTNIEFTDPSGTVGKKDIPLNRWVEVTTQPSTQSIPCPSGLHHTADVFADIKNDDVKVVGLNSADLRIEQADVAKKIEWGVSSQLDAESCSAIVDFHGRFGSDKLTATLLQSKSMSSLKYVFEFTDPKGTLVNMYVEVDRIVTPKNPLDTPKDKEPESTTDGGNTETGTGGDAGGNVGEGSGSGSKPTLSTPVLM
jgi:hypothetical protein